MASMMTLMTLTTTTTTTLAMTMMMMMTFDDDDDDDDDDERKNFDNYYSYSVLRKIVFRSKKIMKDTITGGNWALENSGSISEF